MIGVIQIRLERAQKFDKVDTLNQGIKQGRGIAISIEAECVCGAIKGRGRVISKARDLEFQTCS